MHNWTFLIPIMILLAAFALWTAPLDGLHLWGDELYTAVVTARPVPEMLHAALIDAVHPPFYYLFIHAWSKAAGSTAFALRMPSVLAMLLGIALLARLGREFHSARAGRLALLLGALSPFFFWYAQEMRMYALLFTLTAAEMLLLVLALKGRRNAWAAQAAVTALLVNTHYFGFFALLPPFAFLAAERRRRPQLPRWIAAHAVGAATFIPWLIAWLNRDPKYVGIGWIPALKPVDFLLTLRTFFFSGAESWPWLLAPGAVGLAVAFGAAFLPKDPHRWRPLLLLSWGLPWALAAMISWSILPLYVDRYLMILLPALFVWIGWGLAGLPRLPASLALAGILVGMIGGIIGINTQPPWQRPDWHNAMITVLTSSWTDQIYLTNSPYTIPARLYYAPALPAFEQLTPVTGDASIRAASGESGCPSGRSCWVIWERYLILNHFPPAAADPTTVAQDLAKTNPTAAWLVEHRDACTRYTFTHIEVWRCGE
jgi:4-amino-4-deoxy-L-arabinose transferase-like glycosyltransferase